jgi:prepilin-type N-terminal cleavage/methylation domain-containing protein
VSRNRRGFTLIEIVVALTVSGVVVLLAQAVFSAVTDAGREVRVARLALDREANARRWLQAALLSLDVGSDSAAGSFEGRPDRVGFSTWMETPSGWFRRERVTLGRSHDAFVATMYADTVVLADSVVAVAFDYLLEPGENTKWAREWISPVSAPLAVRIRVTRRTAVDTLLLLIKERG